jgi:predicted trehalose synthase
LHQILRTGTEFTILDFEGEPVRPLFERRLKRSPLTDVASMVRSFDYVTHVALADEKGNIPVPGRRRASMWACFWRHWTTAAFLQTYFSTVNRRLLPSDRDELIGLLEMSLIERTIYELGYELANRHGFIHIPLTDLRRLSRLPWSSSRWTVDSRKEVPEASNWRHHGPGFDSLAPHHKAECRGNVTRGVDEYRRVRPPRASF